MSSVLSPGQTFSPTPPPDIKATREEVLDELLLDERVPDDHVEESATPRELILPPDVEQVLNGDIGVSIEYYMHLHLEMS